MEPRPPASPATDAEISPLPVRGVHIYLKHGNREQAAQSKSDRADASAPTRAMSRSLLLSLFTADALLCGLAAWIVISGNRAIGWLGWTLAGAAIVFGAWLSILAVQAARDAVPADTSKSEPVNGGD